MIEIKNKCYKNFDYNESLWELMNGDSVSNPINQNHTHKLVFCSELGVPREKVITIEILLENGKINGENSPFVNDYIFDRNNFFQGLTRLFATESNSRIEIDKLSQDFINQISKNKIRKKDHVAMLKCTEKIETRIKK